MREYVYNYHTHTFRNHHAVGTEREYIEAAIAGGYQTLGFSEHAPYQFPDGIVSYFHMFPGASEDYIQTLLALKEEYAGRIEILIGYEAEYYPRFFDDLLARITQYPVDYLCRLAKTISVTYRRGLCLRADGSHPQVPHNLCKPMY